MSPGPEPSASSQDLADRSRWLIDELGAYFGGEDAPAETRDRLARDALRSNRSAFESLMASSRPCDAVVTVELSIHGAREGRTGLIRRSHFGQVPGPVALVFLCALNCEIGDVVRVRQTTAAGASVLSEECWPFGVVDAEQMTLPAETRLRAHRVAHT